MPCCKRLWRYPKTSASTSNKIYESIPPPPGFVEMSEVEFVAELERRATEMEQGVDEGIPWSELKKMR